MARLEGGKIAMRQWDKINTLPPFLIFFKGVVTKEASMVRGDHEKFEGACTDVL